MGPSRQPRDGVADRQPQGRGMGVAFNAAGAAAASGGTFLRLASLPCSAGFNPGPLLAQLARLAACLS